MCPVGTPALRMPFMTADSSEAGPQTNTCRAGRSGIQARSVSGENGIGAGEPASRTGEDVEGAVPGGDHALELEPVGDVRLVVDADDDDRTLVRPAVLEQRTDRGDPDAAGDQRRRAPPRPARR